MEFLNVENLCKAYGKGDNQVLALDHVSLTIDKGDFTAIIGTSGSGKSTLLHAIAGVDVPTSGMARTCTHRAMRSWPSSGGGRWD